MADGVEHLEKDIYRTRGGVEEGLKRKADASDVQMDLRRTVEYVTGETRREVRLVMDRIDALRDDFRRDINGIEEDMEKQAKKAQATSDELHDVSDKVDHLASGLAEISELVKGLANRPRTSLGDWVRWGIIAFPLLVATIAALISGNWGFLKGLF